MGIINKIIKKLNPNRPKTINDIFRKYYFEEKKILRDVQLSADPDFELLPALYIVGDLALISSKKDRVHFCNEFIQLMPQLFNKVNEQSFNRRIRLYGEVLREKHNLFLWNPNPPTNIEFHPILKAVYLLCDILYDKSCADDYSENHPIRLHDCMHSIYFNEKVVNPLVTSFGNLFKDVYKF